MLRHSIVASGMERTGVIEMHHHYKDITDKLGEPLWYDEYAVPRYNLFTPDQGADIYAHQIVLLRIACQSCGAKFRVAMSWKVDYPERKDLKDAIKNKWIHYGDPPNSGCCNAGATMNCEELYVLQFWEKDEWCNWHRLPEYEVDLEDEDE